MRSFLSRSIRGPHQACLNAAVPLQLFLLTSGLEQATPWALEYHTLILFGTCYLKGTVFEIKVYTFFPGYFKSQKFPKPKPLN